MPRNGENVNRIISKLFVEITDEFLEKYNRLNDDSISFQERVMAISYNGIEEAQHMIESFSGDSLVNYMRLEQVVGDAMEIISDGFNEVISDFVKQYTEKYSRDSSLRNCYDNFYDICVQWETIYKSANAIGCADYFNKFVG